ncbi:replication-relaxation family protein [Solwaraspora sp. WMMD1047]|uniref:replication-relaxation family protein n=1 Tax=Solwaraspora sp. WMMD1047 TaxID=3016102 RepID=UPI002417DF3A|nr:replication-relaxation family protein [Solwaraspora sp. WMMD1047]MDG4833988.1 replication-relaxation family protein [Solwaraspora sp. WMMD1047]
MARLYAVGPDESPFNPPPRRPDDVRLHGLGRRHWALLSLLAEHGVLHTGQVATLMFGSRPAAARHLGALVRAGVVCRFVYDDDPTHLAHYELSAAGVEVLTQRLQQAGRAVPVALGRPGADLFTVNAFFVGLVAEARQRGRGEVLRWRRALEAALWLREHGVPDVAPSAYGVWIEDGLSVRFVLHVDHDHGPRLSEAIVPPAAEALHGYRHAPRGVPLTAVLVLCPTAGRAAELHRDLAAAPVPVTVASTTFDRFSEASSAAEAIWTVTGNDTPLRLAEVGR